MLDRVKQNRGKENMGKKGIQKGRVFRAGVSQEREHFSVKASTLSGTTRGEKWYSLN